MRKPPALRLFLEGVAELRSKIAWHAVIVRFTRCGFGDRGVVEFGKLDEVFLLLATGSILKGLLNRFAHIDRPLNLFAQTTPRH